MQLIKFTEPALKLDSKTLDQFSFPCLESIYIPMQAPQPQKDFLEVLYGRRCTRQFTEAQLMDFGPLFFHGSHRKRRFRDAKGGRYENRNYASGGALHSIHSLLTPLSEDIWYVYNATRHSFDVLSITADDIVQFKQTCSELLDNTQNAWLIWYVCDFDRLTSRYENAESVIFREAGHLSATHALVAQSLGLAYCPLGYHGYAEAANLSPQRKFVGTATALIANR